MSSDARCTICGEPMPEGEEMFKFHGYSGPCPKPPLQREKTHAVPPTFLSPERVREIVNEIHMTAFTEKYVVSKLIPELASVTLEWAATEFERQADAAPSGAYRDALWHLIGMLRQAAQEIEP